MRTHLIRLTVVLLLLAACDKKKYTPTETRGSMIDPRRAPSAPSVQLAPSGPTRVG